MPCLFIFIIYSSLSGLESLIPTLDFLNFISDCYFSTFSFQKVLSASFCLYLHAISIPINIFLTAFSQIQHFVKSALLVSRGAVCNSS